MFTREGIALGRFGQHGTGPGEFDLPYAIAIGPSGKIYVADSGNDRIQIFTADHQWILTFGETGTGPGQMDLPWGIAIDSNENVFVADAKNDRIEKFSAGTFVPVQIITWGKIKQRYK